MEFMALKIILVCCVIVGEIHLLLAIKSEAAAPNNLLEMYEMLVESDIRNRYARTTVVQRLESKAETEQNYTCNIFFPEDAYVTGFVLEVNNTNYTAFVTGRMEDDQNNTIVRMENTKNIYERNTNRFSLSTTIKPSERIAFYLMYDHMLTRQDSLYTHIMNIHTEQSTPISVEARIKEETDLINLQATQRICKKDMCESIPRSINHLKKSLQNGINIRSTFYPKRENDFKRSADVNIRNDVPGQFIIQYDIDKNLRAGDILTNNGYCVQCFSPKNLQHLSRYVIFILDTSKSMDGPRLRLLKQAMDKILDTLHNNDYFTIIEFNTFVSIWNLHERKPFKVKWIETGKGFFISNIQKARLPKPHRVNEGNIQKGKTVISKLKAEGSTNIYSALKIGLHLVEILGDQLNDTKAFISFLTDGEPYMRHNITKDEIVEKISELNNGLRKSSIFTLAFGTETDLMFLKKLAKRNGGFAEQIYVASDAPLQLQKFYQRISTPVLTNITFHIPSAVNATRTNFPILFNGSELVVAWQCNYSTVPNIVIDGWSATGPKRFTNFTMVPTDADLRRTWVYITITDLMEESDKEEDAEKRNLYLNKVYELALANSFATLVTSLVIPKPENETIVVNPVPLRPGRSVFRPGSTPSPFISLSNIHPDDDTTLNLSTQTITSTSSTTNAPTNFTETITSTSSTTNAPTNFTQTITATSSTTNAPTNFIQTITSTSSTTNASTNLTDGHSGNTNNNNSDDSSKEAPVPKNDGWTNSCTNIYSLLASFLILKAKKLY